MFFKRKSVGSAFGQVDAEKESQTKDKDVERVESEESSAEKASMSPVEAKLKAIEEQKKLLEHPLLHGFEPSNPIEAPEPPIQ